MQCNVKCTILLPPKTVVMYSHPLCVGYTLRIQQKDDVVEDEKRSLIIKIIIYTVIMMAKIQAMLSIA